MNSIIDVYTITSNLPRCSLWWSMVVLSFELPIAAKRASTEDENSDFPTLMTKDSRAVNSKSIAHLRGRMHNFTKFRSHTTNNYIESEVPNVFVNIASFVAFKLRIWRNWLELYLRNFHSNPTAGLYLASSVGSLKYLAIYLVQGGDIEGRNSFGETPLIAAAENGHFAAVAYLLASGADPSAMDVAGETALEKAKRRKNVASLLICQLLDENMERQKEIISKSQENGLANIAKSIVSKAQHLLPRMIVLWLFSAGYCFAAGHFDWWLLEV